MALFQPLINATSRQCFSLVQSLHLLAPGVVQHPQDQVLLTSYDEETVQFVCKYEFAGVSWKVNGTNFNQPGFRSSQTYSGNITTSTLTFPALTEYNQTRFQCIGYNDGAMLESNLARLSYQGTVFHVITGV